jgi:NTP pyrophosphatase (non-canonical NTP hydrolase)
MACLTTGENKMKVNDCESFDGYQKLTLVTREYPMCGDNLVYPSLKLAGESGELADKIGKHWRNKAKEYRQSKKLYGLGSSELHAMAAVSYSEDEKQAALKELGDVLWYIAAIATEFGVPLSEIARMNIAKTHDRKERDVICSEGDSR